jgi:hypothetical protein
MPCPAAVMNAVLPESRPDMMRAAMPVILGH